MIKVLITGVSGMLGKDLAEIFLQDKKYKVFGIARHRPNNLPDLNFIKLDLLNLSKLKTVLKRISPDIIIHSAAIVNLDRCDQHKAEARIIHARAAKIFAAHRRLSTRLIYISTDSVFDGRQGNYKETSKTRPLNYYAKTKRRGEEIVLKESPNSLVIRTNIFGFHQIPGASLAEWGLDNLFKKRAINGFVDVRFNPVYTKQLARVIKQIADQEHFLPRILNVGSGSFLSKYNFLIKLAEIFKQNKALITKSKISQSALAIARPRNTTLNTVKLEKIFKQKLGLVDGLREFKKDFLEYKSKK
jgi:dTDP-4-dehydrorhamnose reductase